MSSVSKSEASYIKDGILASPESARVDGRGLTDYRPIFVEMGVAELANGSGRAILGGNGNASLGTGEIGTEAIVAARLEVEDIAQVYDSAMSFSVTCTPSAYPHLSPGQLDDLSNDLSCLLRECFQSSEETLASQLSIVPGKKRWHLTLEAIIISDAGNTLDALVIASRAALWDLRIPKTRALEYQADKKARDDEMEVEGGQVDALKTVVRRSQKSKTGVDFELEDYWDGGIPLAKRETLPVCVTLQLVHPTHFLDATLTEALACPAKLHLTFSFFSSTSVPRCVLQNSRLSGPTEVPIKTFKALVENGERYAAALSNALNVKLKAEDKL